MEIFFEGGISTNTRKFMDFEVTIQIIETLIKKTCNLHEKLDV